MQNRSLMCLAVYPGAGQARRSSQRSSLVRCHRGSTKRSPSLTKRLESQTAEWQLPLARPLRLAPSSFVGGRHVASGRKRALVWRRETGELQRCSRSFPWPFRARDWWKSAIAPRACGRGAVWIWSVQRTIAGRRFFRSVAKGRAARYWRLLAEINSNWGSCQSWIVRSWLAEAMRRPASPKTAP